MLYLGYIYSINFFQFFNFSIFQFFNFSIIKMNAIEIYLYFLEGFFSPVSSRWKYLAKKYWSTKETTAREVTYAWKHASKLNTYKGFFIPSVKPKAELSDFFFQKREEDEKILKSKFRGGNFFKKKNTTDSIPLKKKKYSILKKKKFDKFIFYIKKLFLSNFIFFKTYGSGKKIINSNSFSFLNFLKLSRDYIIFLKKKKIFNFKYKNFSNKNFFTLFGSLKIDYDWFIINWGFDTPQFFNFFFLLKLPTYLVPINFNFLKLKFLKSIKKLFKKKFYFFWKKFNLYFSSNFSMFFLYKNSLFLYKKNIEKLFFFLNIYLNWVSLYSKINIFWNIMLLFLLEKSNIFFKKFIFFTLKLLLDRIAFIKYLLNNSLISSKKKLLLNFISTIVGNKTFYFWIKKKWKKTNFLNLTSLNLNILNVYYLSSNFLKEFFFLTRNLNFSSKFFGFDLVNFISWFYKNFINFLIQKKQFNTSPNNFFFNMCCGIQKKIIFLSISKKKYENFSYFYLKNIQNYKNINMLLNQSFSQQLDVYVNLNLINLLFWFLIWWGKKLTAWRVFINFIKQFKEKYKMPALAIFTHAVLKTEPKIWLKKKKIAGRLYEIPIFISSRRSKSIAIRWLLEYAKKRQKYNISDSLSQEIWDACFNWGSTAHAWTVVHTTAKWNKSYMWWF